MFHPFLFKSEETTRIERTIGLWLRYLAQPRKAYPHSARRSISSFFADEFRMDKDGTRLSKEALLTAFFPVQNSPCFAKAQTQQGRYAISSGPSSGKTPTAIK